MSNVNEYKCPCCGGAIEFNSNKQKMTCPYCDAEFEMSALEALDAESSELGKEEDPKWDASSPQWGDEELEGMKIYQCQSCGGEIVGDRNTAATKCPYCDNPVVMKGQFAGDLKPDYVIPFKLDKKAAKEALRNHCKGKFLLPTEFKNENHIDEIQGIYVPFWLFSAKADAKTVFNGQRIRTWSDSQYNYIETSHYRLLREGTLSFEQIPVDGSTKMPDDIMESIEPYDFKEAVDFQTAYLAGYLSDRYDVDADQSILRANARIRNSAVEVMRDSIFRYESVTLSKSNIALSDGVVNYALYPVWMLTTSWKGKSYMFAMNGQTGKFVGNLPADTGKFWKVSLGLFVGLGVIISGILALI